MCAKSLDRAEQEQTIKRVLRRCGSRDYFKHGGWTNDPAEADNFSDVVEVAEICAQYGLSDVELAVRYDRAACDLFCTPIR
jgi:hypothetical protein